MNPPDVMDKEQCAKYLGVGTTTVERWRDTEGLPYIKIGAIARYRRAAIDAWLAARELAVLAQMLAEQAFDLSMKAQQDSAASDWSSAGTVMNLVTDVTRLARPTVYIPEHLLTKEFLTEVKGILGPRGVISHG